MSVVINGQPPVRLVLTQTPGVGAPGVGLPAGGTTGQVLAKNSGTDYDTEWISASGVGDLLAANNLSELTATAATARTNIGAEAAGAAAAAQSAAIAAAATDATTKANAAQAAAIAASDPAGTATSAVSSHAGTTSGVHGISTFGANLVDDADAATARTTLGLGTAATTAASAYATAAQGATADTAVQPARTISTTAPLTGGGDLSANRTLAVSAATDTAAGVVELATDAETVTGTDTTRATTPAGVAAAIAAGGGGGSGGVGSASPRHSDGTTLYIVFPGCVWHGTGDSAYVTMVANTTYYGRIVITEDVEVAAIGCYSNGGGSGGDALVGLYEADRYWQPGDLVAEFGTLSFASSGNKMITGLSTALTPGRYMTALHALKSGGGAYHYKVTPITGAMLAPNGPDGVMDPKATQTITALPSTGVKWASMSTVWAPAGERQSVYFRLN